MGTERYLDSPILLNYDDDNFSQGYGQIRKNLELQTKMISLNQLYLIMILDHLILVITLDINYTFLIYDIR